MKIKKYEAANMKEALQLIKQDLGADAVILSTRKVMKNNNFGLFAKPVLEVTATADYETAGFKTNANATSAAKPPLGQTNLGYSKYSNISAGDTIPQGSKNFLSSGRTETLPDRKVNFFTEEDLYIEDKSLFPNSPPEPAYLPAKEKSNGYITREPVREEISEEKLAKLLESCGLNKFNELLKDVGDLKKQIGDMKSGISENVVIDLPQRLKEYHTIMTKNGVDNVISYRFLKRVEERLRTVASNVQVKDMIGEMLAGIVSVAPDYSVVFQKRIFALVGPTGVGKTTTIAKIAAVMTLKHKRRVCLITIDNFRIGAVDQLRTYAEIVNIPLYVATNTEEFRRIVKEVYGKYDCVLIDSMGRSQFDSNQIGNIATILKTEYEITVGLVLSMAANHGELGDSIDRYNTLAPDYLIFTKLDETRFFGPLLNLPVLKRIPLLLITTGQNVPDDMEEPDGKKIAKKILQEIPTIWSAK